MFLIPTLPHDTSRLGTYADALAAAFDLDEFRRFYADYFGRVLDDEVDTQGGFADVLFRLVKQSQHDGTLRELLITALCFRAGNMDLVHRLCDVLAIAPIVELATLLADAEYPPDVGQRAANALYTGRGMRARAWRSWAHYERRAAWLEVLVVCDKLATGDDRVPPLLDCLHTVDQQCPSVRGAPLLRSQIEAICRKYGLPRPHAAAGAQVPPTAEGPRAVLNGESTRRIHRTVRRNTVLRAIESAWRAATSDGQGAYQFAMIAFGLTAFLFHDSLQPQKLEQAYLKENLGLQQEPLRSERYPVLDGLLLPGPSGREGAPSDALPELCNAQLVQVLDRAYEQFRDAYARTRPYRFHLQQTQQAKTEGLGASWTDDDSATTLLIPSSLAHMATRPTLGRVEETRDPAGAGAGDGSDAGASEGAREAKGSDEGSGASAGSGEASGSAAGAGGGEGEGKRESAGKREGKGKGAACAGQDMASQLLCKFREPIERSLAIAELATIQKQHEDRISSFYFISPEGIERSFPYFVPTLLPAHRGVTGESYVYRALSSDFGVFSEGPQSCRQLGAGKHRRIGTFPYFDLVGSGMQETACYPVEVAGAAGAAEVVGVLCADITIPPGRILARLEQASTIFDLSIVKLSRSEHDGLTPETCHESSLTGFHCSPRMAQISRERSQRLAQRYYEQRLSPTSSTRSDPFGLGGVSFVEDDYFGVVIAADHPDRGPWYVAIGRIRTAKSRNYVSLVLCVLMLLAGISVLASSFRRKLKRQQALLARGLPYGLLEIEDGKIIGANDRAEEILFTNLPRLGALASQNLAKKTLSGMLDDRCVLIPASGQLRADSIRTYDTTIRDRTSDGLTSVFYAWVKLRRGWIKITSTVILKPDGSEHVFCALDTNIDEAHRLFLANVQQGER